MGSFVNDVTQLWTFFDTLFLPSSLLTPLRVSNRSYILWSKSLSPPYCRDVILTPISKLINFKFYFNLFLFSSGYGWFSCYPRFLPRRCPYGAKFINFVISHEIITQAGLKISHQMSDVIFERYRILCNIRARDLKRLWDGWILSDFQRQLSLHNYLVILH